MIHHAEMHHCRQQPRAAPLLAHPATHVGARCSHLLVNHACRKACTAACRKHATYRPATTRLQHKVGQGSLFLEPFTAPANKVSVHRQLQRLPRPAALNQHNNASIAALLVAELTTLPAECASDPIPWRCSHS